MLTAAVWISFHVSDYFRTLIPFACVQISMEVTTRNPWLDIAGPSSVFTSILRSVKDDVLGCSPKQVLGNLFPSSEPTSYDRGFGW